MSRKEHEEATQGEHAAKRADDFDAGLQGTVFGLLILTVLCAWGIAGPFVPDLEHAHASMVYAKEASPFYGFLRSLLWFAQSGLFVCAFLLINIRLWRGAALRGMRGRWMAVLVAMALLVAWSFFWQLLAMDQSAWHGTLARKGVIEATPMLGESLSQWLFPSGTITQETLSFFDLMATSVFPALMLFAAYALWHTRSKSRRNAFFYGSSIALGFVMLLAWLIPSVAALEVSASNEFPDVRPEWFFLPLSKALGLAAANPLLSALIATAPGLFFFGVGLRPWIPGTWIHFLDRFAVAFLAIGFSSLLAFGLAADYDKSEGYFAEANLEGVMLALGEANQAIGDESQHTFNHAYPRVADLLILAEQCESLAETSDEVKDAEQWRELSLKMRAAAAKIWQSGPRDQAALASAISDFRTTCETCHEAYEETIEVRNFAKLAPLKPTPKDPNPIDPEPPVEPEANGFKGYELGALATLKPLSPTPTTFDDDSFEEYMKDMMRLVKRICEDDPKDLLQELIDLRALALPMDFAGHPDVRTYLYDEGMSVNEYIEEDWLAISRLLNAAIQKTLDAKSSKDWYAGATMVRDACAQCHDDLDFGDGKIIMPPAPTPR